MAKLSRLGIAGIRSFGPDKDDMQHIKFLSPVTLILGQNGSGKTTIIESLKYATTGEMPVGTKNGQGFLNDPKLSNNLETYGQVLLEIKDLKGEKVVITRSMKVTQKKDNKLEFKTLDNNLTNGEGISISSRCIDASENICTSLGVSKSILNNVLFCHQEESNWPMDEPKKLKDRFDEIFDSTKYNKACDGFRKIIKDRETNLKILKERLKGLEDRQKLAANKKKLLTENEAKKVKFDDEIAGLNDEIQPIGDEIIKIQELERNIEKHESNLRIKDYQLSAQTDQIKDLLKEMDDKEFTGSDVDLQEEINKLATEQNDAEKSIVSLNDKLGKAEEQQNIITDKISVKQVSIGRLQSEKQQNDLDTETRKDRIEQANANFETLIDVPLDTDEEIKSSINTLKEELNKLKQNIIKSTASCEKDENDLQAIVDVCRDNCVKIQSNIDSKRKDISQCQLSSTSAQSKLREYNLTNNEIEAVKQKIEKLNKSMDTIKAAHDPSSQAKIDDNNARIQEKEKQLSLLEKEYKILQRNSITDNELQSQKRTAADCKNKLENLYEKHGENFKVLFDAVPKKGLKAAVEEIISTERREIKRLESNKLDVEKQKTTTETKINYEKDKLKTFENDLKNGCNKIQSIIDKRDYDTVLIEIQTKLEKKQNEVKTYSVSNHVFETFIKDFQAPEPCCPVCQTNFKQQQNAVKRIVQTLNAKIQDLPTKMTHCTKEVNELKNKHENLLSLKPVQDNVTKLKESIPTLMDLISDLNDSLLAISTEQLEILDAMKGPQQKINTANLILTDASLIEKYRMDIANSYQKIQELENQLIPTNSDDSIEEMSMLIDNSKEDINTLKTAVDNAKQRIERYNTQLQDVRDKRNYCVEQQLKLEKDKQNVVQLESKLKENKAKETQLLTEIETLNKKLIELNVNLQAAQEHRNRLKANNKTLLSEMTNEYNSNNKKVDEILSLHKKICHFIESDKDNILNESLNRLNELKEKLKKYDEAKKKISDFKDKLQNKIANSEKTMKYFNNNLLLRKKRLDAEKLKEDVEELRQFIGEQNKASLIHKRREFESKYSNLTDKKSRMQGSITELENIIKEIKKELNSPELRDITNKHKEQFCRNRVTEKTIDELKMYLNSLEHAVMQFHKQRMIQINGRLRDLWRCVYKGNDCDYIEIKTEETTVGASKKRTYNYKVMQLKQNVMLEMRGRCSAGQRVLACLLIRIALAETFSSNCGILALDEPTTNLDKENIISLSRALATIISNRQNEKNFQLLVITHDEEFLDALRTAEGIRYYYKVSRNPRGLSRIEKQCIS